ncbi:MAG TPA: hypothetical protein PLO94_11060 [Chitinophagales bacterium]|nr:hypothetical protein [Chitinophagales bacterium]
MENYKEVIRKKVRFATEKGELSVEQLWDLTIPQLDKLAVSLDEKYKNSNTKSFVEKKTTKDKDLKLQLDVVLDILETKVDEAELVKQRAERKERNQKIYKLIEEKKDKALEGKSIKELTAMLEDED